MVINVSDALNSDIAEEVTIYRSSGNYIDGIYLKDDPELIETIASVQQPNDDELESLTSGERDSDPLKFITKQHVQTVSDRDGLPADEIFFNNRFYKIIKSQLWDAYGHTTSIGVRIES
jgi:hypothetical protein